jgi:hypothetical protein
MGLVLNHASTKNILLFEQCITKKILTVMVRYDLPTNLGDYFDRDSVTPGAYGCRQVRRSDLHRLCERIIALTTGSMT